MLSESGTSLGLFEVMAPTEKLGEGWSSLHFDQRRALIGLLLDRVEVRPAVRGRNFFDPERFTLVWREF